MSKKSWLDKELGFYNYLKGDSNLKTYYIRLTHWFLRWLKSKLEKISNQLLAIFKGHNILIKLDKNRLKCNIKRWCKLVVSIGLFFLFYFYMAFYILEITKSNKFFLIDIIGLIIGVILLILCFYATLSLLDSEINIYENKKEHNPKLNKENKNKKIIEVMSK